MKWKTSLATIALLISAIFVANSYADELSGTSGTQDVANETILVVGASGMTGGLMIRRLHEADRALRAMTRDKERAIDNFGDSYDWIEADVRDIDSLKIALAGVDKVICSIGATEASGENSPEFVDYGGVKNLVDVSLEAGIKHFVLISSRGVTQEDHLLNEAFANVLKWKFKGEEYLRQSGLSYTIVRPGGLTNWPGGTMVIKVMQGDDPNVQGYVTRADVAIVAIEALTNPQAHNKTFEILNVVESYDENWVDALAELQSD